MYQGRLTLPEDWVPQHLGSRNPSPAGMNEPDAESPSLLELRIGNASSELAAPILQSPRGSITPPPGGQPLNSASGNAGVDPASNPNSPQRHQPAGGAAPRGNHETYRHPLPQPRPFDGKGNRDINIFFSAYEKFATSSWGACRADWGAGLEQHLKGWALILYQNMMDQGSPYDDIKKALQMAFPGIIDPFKSQNLIKLVNLKREDDEPLPVFFMRVDQIIRETYPNLEEE